MRRRDFIVGLGGMAVAWPDATGAQQRAPMRRIGVLMPAGTDRQLYIRALREGLEALGWIDGKNIQIESRWAPGEPDGLAAEVASLLALDPEVLVSGGTQATAILKEATRKVPIVFVHVADPVRGGIIQSLAHPEGNITGFAAYESTIASKWLELLKEIVPRVKRVLVLTGSSPTWRMHVETLEGVAPSFDVKLTIAHLGTAAEIETTINAFAGKPDSGIIALPDNLLFENQDQIATLAARHGLPDVHGNTASRQAGGLLRYSSDWPDLYRRCASYVDKILKGTKPGELPVQQPVKFQLIINLKTAAALGLSVPPTLLARADQVIE